MLAACGRFALADGADVDGDGGSTGADATVLPTPDGGTGADGSADAAPDAPDPYECSAFVPDCHTGTRCVGSKHADTGEEGFVTELPDGGGVQLTPDDDSRVGQLWVPLGDLLQGDFRLSVDVEVEGKDGSLPADGFAFAFLHEIAEAGAPYPQPKDRSGSALGVVGITDFRGGAFLLPTDIRQNAFGGLTVGTLILPGGGYVPVFTGTPFGTAEGVHLRFVFDRAPAAIDGGAAPDGGDAGDGSTSGPSVRVALWREGVLVDGVATLPVPSDATHFGVSASTGLYHSDQRVTRIERCTLPTPSDPK